MDSLTEELESAQRLLQQYRALSLSVQNATEMGVVNGSKAGLEGVPQWFCNGVTVGGVGVVSPTLNNGGVSPGGGGGGGTQSRTDLSGSRFLGDGAVHIAQSRSRSVSPSRPNIMHAGPIIPHMPRRVSLSPLREGSAGGGWGGERPRSPLVEERERERREERLQQSERALERESERARESVWLEEESKRKERERLVWHNAVLARKAAGREKEERESLENDEAYAQLRERERERERARAREKDREKEKERERERGREKERERERAVERLLMIETELTHRDRYNYQKSCL